MQVWKGQRQRGTEDPKQAPCWEQRAWCGARTPEPWDHDLGRSRTPNRMSHPGAPNPRYFLRFYSAIYIVGKGGKRTRNLATLSWDNHWKEEHWTFIGHCALDVALAPQDPLRKAWLALQLSPYSLSPLPLWGHIPPQEEHSKMGTAATVTVPNAGLYSHHIGSMFPPYAVSLLPGAHH